MDPNGMFPGINSGENPLQQSQQNQNNPHPQNQNPHTFHHPSPLQMSPYSGITKQQMTPVSDEDDGGFVPDDVTSEDPTKKASQWHRMKWTDTMVRLLIMAVYFIGDIEPGSDGGDKRKPTGLLQKKGKWKSVSRAMMEKGFFVSPQQCEDKFNDLNKRYKRVNDILGKGTSCLVVENHNLLDTMDLSPKLKDEVRKLLNSKHLFFREMCAYHTSCAHGGSSGCWPQQSPDVSQQNHHQQCSHSSEKILKEKEEEDDDDEDDDESEDSSDEEEEESGESSKKRRRKAETMRSEVMGVLEDGGRSTWEKKQWMKRRLIELEEEKLRYEMDAFELEKQKLKWVRFSSKKEREMEKAKLENERRKLENDRMVLAIRQKEIELLHQQQNSN